ncbi:MAG: hypothetical protein FVQ80_13260 [Planctomycetes bacterium]|nr:hypothetical protein [Planctomycetota bacterium]
MGILKLRSHIPIAGPARREPADGSESALRVSLGFEPAWFNKRCGIDFSEKWHKDPLYRYESLIAMKRELKSSFPQISCWDRNYLDDLATISGCYGAYPVPYVFGMQLIYAPDRWPALDPRGRLSPEQIEALEVDKVLESPAVAEIFDQIEQIEAEWGKVHGYLNWQGVLNNAFNLRGQEIFLDIMDKPDLVHHFFSVIAEVMIGLAKKVQERQRQSGFYINQLSVSNCVMNMISPQTYAEFVFPYDARIALSFERFGVHTCNWNVTPYVEVLKELPSLGYLDMGIMSDLPRVSLSFPESYLAVIYSPVKLHQGTWADISSDLEKIFTELAPCDLVMADVQAATPDNTVNRLLKICSELAEGRVG